MKSKVIYNTNFYIFKFNNLIFYSLKLGKPVQIEVSSLFSIPYLMYIIMGHASLIHSEHIKVPANQKSYTITITPTIEMIPQSFIYVYYIYKGNLRYEEMILTFPDEFENQVFSMIMIELQITQGNIHISDIIKGTKTS